MPALPPVAALSYTGMGIVALFALWKIARAKRSVAPNA
jgi:hypothetical protein